jgi:plastocyanin
MIRKNYLILAITILTVAISLTEFVCAAEKQAEEIKVSNRVVTLNHEQGPMPVSLTSKLGTTVIWVNYSRSSQMIFFPDKKVVLACGSPVNFFVNKDGTYESAEIPFGGTASLCFTEKGKYEYLVGSPDKGARDILFTERKKRSHRGIIWIK